MSEVRDLLLPGLWGMEMDGYCDLFDDNDGGISIVMQQNTIKLLTADEIGDGSFKAKFAPRLRQIKEHGTWH